MLIGQRRGVTRTEKGCYKDREGVLIGQRRGVTRTEKGC